MLRARSTRTGSFVIHVKKVMQKIRYAGDPEEGVGGVSTARGTWLRTPWLRLAEERRGTNMLDATVDMCEQLQIQSKRSRGIFPVWRSGSTRCGRTYRASHGATRDLRCAMRLHFKIFRKVVQNH